MLIQPPFDFNTADSGLSTVIVAASGADWTIAMCSPSSHYVSLFVSLLCVDIRAAMEYRSQKGHATRNRKTQKTKGHATEYFTDRRKIGEGVYGPVYKCHLDHTAVAVKVLRPDAAQGRSQFHQEIEVLSCIRHPHMVLLLGAYPEYGCIVYEYMANGSLEDRLFRRGNTPTVPWKYCFRIAAEIATPLLFLHHMKPEPLVHRDLKPANILLDRNYVCKIGDVALAYLVPPSVTDSVMQYRVTSTAGTFCYIDPEYQQTGMLGVQSDIYSLGVMLLQIIITKPPMGLTHHVSRTIEHGELESMLDPEVADWPVHEAQRYTEIALKCAELRQKDWPDMEKAILPELNRLRAPGDCNFVFYLIRTPTDGSPGCQVSHQVNHFIAP
ncbi:U-box domain-containing protein 52-like [Zingiber officinale]|uniref:U-box domain-containing protein 52-like n=1 Tax=Zingiber officinale TaxID=94328 RepID=UPI001C4BF3E5|nr:U-box domain-containing protein 52-like [Zingiber officinale]